MSTGRHQAPLTLGQKLTKRYAKVPLFVWLIGMLGAGVAIAAIVFSLGISGSVSLSNFGVAYETATVTSQTDPGDCVVSTTSGNMTVTWTGAQAGDQCTIGVEIISDGNDESVYLADFISPDPDLAMTLVSGAPWQGCHMEVPPGTTTTDDKNFRLRLTVDAAATGGTVIDLTGASIEFADLVTDGDCNSTT